MYGTQCNDIISNIVFIRMFFTLFSNRMISFFTLHCELFTSCNVSNNASLVSTRTGGGGWSTKCGAAWTEGAKNSQICADILFDDPLIRQFRRKILRAGKSSVKELSSRSIVDIIIAVKITFGKKKFSFFDGLLIIFPSFSRIFSLDCMFLSCNVRI